MQDKQPVINNATKQDEYIEILQKHFPSAISQKEDGSYIVNKEQLQLMLDPKNCTVIENGYGLNWVGKKEAYHNAYTSTNKRLKPLIEDSKEFDSTGNILIKGDNLDALKLLRNNYFEKVKMIYIDPPYNTKNDGFIYNDDFSTSQQEVLEELGYSPEQKEYIKNIAGAKTHSGWLSFMYPRLLLARDLLKDDGIIFISIDDNEQANLKLLCDEVFGEENFVSCLPTIMNLKGNNDEFGFAGTHEYTLVYLKDINKGTIGEFKIDDVSALETWLKDEYGFYKKGAQLKATGENAPRDKRPNLFFPIYIKDNSFSLNELPGYTEVYPRTEGKDMSWRWGREKFLKEDYNILITRTGNTYTIFKKQRPTLSDIPSQKPKSIFYKPEYSSGNGTGYLKAIFGAKIFTNPKPLALIKDFIQIGANSDDIILDFFAGSGTTGDAVMQLNAADRGTRKYILVQIPDKIDSKKNDEAYKFVSEDLKKETTIFEITAERLRRAGDKITNYNNKYTEPKDLQNLDTGFKIYEIDDDKYNSIYLKKMNEINQIELNNIDIEAPSEDSLTILTNLLLGSGVTLDTSIEVIIPDTLYKVDNKLFILNEFDLKPELFNTIEYVIVYARYFKDDNFILNLTSFVDKNKITIKG